MGIPLFSTMAVAMLGGAVWMGAQALDAAERRDAEVTQRVAVRQQAERRAASAEKAEERRTRTAKREEARERLHAAGERCMKDRQRAHERAIKRAKRGGDWRVRVPTSCKRYEKMAADARG